MGVVQLPDDVTQLIHQPVEAGRADSDSEFVAAAVQRYAAALDVEKHENLAAADEGMADVEAGRFQLIAGPSGRMGLRAELGAKLDQRAAAPGLSKR